MCIIFSGDVDGSWKEIDGEVKKGSIFTVVVVVVVVSLLIVICSASEQEKVKCFNNSLLFFQRNEFGESISYPVAVITE